MDKFFSWFGKIILIVLIGGAIAFGGYYLGKNGLSKKPMTTPTSTNAVTVVPTQAILSPTQAPQATGRFAVTAGGVKPFAAYTLSGVAGWTQNHEITSGSDKLTLSKGIYQIVILQAALGGGGCSFPGTTPAMMSVALTSSIDIPLVSGSPLRRGQTQSPQANQLSFTICQKGTDGSFGTFTDYGVINYTTPLNPDAQILAEMDAMVGSLQKK